MVKTAKGTKRKKNQVDNSEHEFFGSIPAWAEGGFPDEALLQNTPIDERQGTDIGSESEKEPSEREAEKESNAVPEETEETAQPQPKKHRGLTKMKDIARDPNAKIRVEFTGLGEPCGEGSVKLSSYLGPLVREHVPVLIDDWKKIGEERKTVLWKSVKV
ncbi:unnamed protein product [Microthlaspi erraticum]|uniref:Uncharacterized protein n=1 Tax=Microthlaspi erraticum TaxID=1685480 RepID=A0A6D2JHL3_9BRAS|nr:unnamed protein product [Microthlaspi erraticum]